MSNPYAFEVAAAFDPAPLLEALGQGWALTEEPAARRRYECADSFDWRLRGEGLSLVLVRVGNQRRWELRSADGAVLSVSSAGGLPARLEDLPSGPLVESLAEALPPRALLARAAVEARVRRWRLLDAEGKTVVRLVEEDGVAARPEDGRGAVRHGLPRRVLLQPLKGYDDVGDRVAFELESRLGATRVAACPCAAAYRATGVVPGSYSSKIRVPLIPALTAAEAAHRIFLHLLDTLEANVAGTRADLDPEFLHDLRVAVRRTRSALSQIKRVLPDERVAPFREGFNWLGQVTGPKRDLDVFLLQFPDYREGVPGDLRADLEPFRQFLLEELAREGAALARRLASPHFHALVRDWRAFLEAPPELDAAPNAARPVKDVADARIWRLFRRIVAAGREMGEAPAPEQLHELRKDCKKLRYLMEFFASLYPAEALDPMVRALKGLLDILGEHQDLAVQAQHLEGFAERMAAQGRAPARTLLALGALVGRLMERRDEVRAEYAAAFAALAGAENRAAYRALFKPAPDPAS
jgi:CHAD domain-containing protein